MVLFSNPFDKTELRRLRGSGKFRRVLYYVCWLPVYLLWLFFDALGAWWTTRRHHPLKPGLPALLLGVLLGAVLLLAMVHRPYERIREYGRSARDAAGDGDLETAHIYLRKLVQLGNEDSATLLLAAQVASRLGKEGEKESLLNRLTEEGAGYVPAYLWRAKDALAQQREGDLEKAERQLLLLLRLDADHGEANLLMGKLKLQQELPEEAVKYFEAAAKDYPEARLLVAVAFREMGDAAQAREIALKAALQFERQRDAPENQRPEVRRQWAIRVAKAEVFLKRFDDALRTLLAEEPPQVGGGTMKKVMAEPMADVYLEWWDELREDWDFERAARGYTLLGQAFMLSPSHPGVIERLAELAGYADAEVALSKELCNELVANGHEPHLAHFVAGTAAFRRGEMEEGRLHLGLARGFNALTDRLLAALALWLASTRDEESALNPELPLVLVDQALAGKTGDPGLVGVRGLVLLRLGRWEDAARELETAVVMQPERAEFHDSLALCYGRLGDYALMNEHKAKAKEKRETAKD